MRYFILIVEVNEAYAQCHDFYFWYLFFRKTSGTIDVIGGGTATISRVEGRRRHNLEGNNIQVQTVQHGHTFFVFN